MSRGWALSATWIGAIIGAGFATGRESAQFFGGFGPAGLMGVVIATGILALFTWAFLSIAGKIQSDSHRQIFMELLGPGGVWGEGIFTLFLFAGLWVMLAGSGALLEEFFGLRPWVGIWVMVGAVWLSLRWGGKGFLRTNAVLVPILLGFSLLLSIRTLMGASPVTTGGGLLLPNWWTAAILYGSYNSLLITAAFSGLGHELRHPGPRRTTAILGPLALAVSLLLSCLALLYMGPQVLSKEIPLLLLAQEAGIAAVYTLTIWLAILTTSMANTYASASWLKDRLGVSWNRSLILTLILAVPGAHLGFGQLVGWIYPLFGYLSFPLLVLVIIGGFRVGETGR